MGIENLFTRDMESRLYLPRGVVDQLEIERLEAERLAAEGMVEVNDAGNKLQTVPARKKSRREQEIDDLLNLPVTDPVHGVPNRLRLFDIAEARKAIAAAIAVTIQEEARDRLRDLLRHSANSGEYRILSELPVDWKIRIERLKSEFPNFLEPLNHLQSMLAFSEVRDGTIHFEPLLFNGPPGIGKTHFCRSLSSTLGGEFRFFQMEQQQESSGLTGSSKFWSNTSAGVVFESLMYGKVANLLFMVDEVDKASKGEFDPLAGLYGLLERNSATMYVDQSVPWVTLDASRILWVLTSNTLEKIPSPIRSRLRVFEIEAPKPEEMRGIILRIFEGICRESLNGRPMSSPSEIVVERLLALPPRRIRPALTEAIGQALFENRRELQPGDISEGVEVKRSIGFLST